MNEVNVEKKNEKRRTNEKKRKPRDIRFLLKRRDMPWLSGTRVVAILTLTLVIILAGCIFTKDSDGDGYPDEEDMFPDDPEEWLDADGDGVGDNSDVFSNDPEEWLDTDGDGVGDNSDAFPNDPAEASDTDGDGYGDITDEFPDNPEEWLDRDKDGYGDNVEDKFPGNPLEWADTDGDGRGDKTDVFPNDPTEWWDSDGDGYGDNQADCFPGDRTEWEDQDGDGYGDNQQDLFPDDARYHMVCSECNGTGKSLEKDYLKCNSSGLLRTGPEYGIRYELVVTVGNEDTEGGVFKVEAWVIHEGKELYRGQDEHFIDAGESHEFVIIVPHSISHKKWPNIGQGNLRYKVMPPSWVVGGEIICPVCEGTGKE